MSEELPGLTGKTLFGRKERLYAAPDVRVAERVVEQEKPIKKEKSVDVKPEPARAPSPVVDDFGDDDISRTREWVSSLLELLGIADMTYGGLLIAPWLGFMLLGLLLIVLGVATGYRA